MTNFRVAVLGGPRCPYPDRIVNDLTRILKMPEVRVLTVVHGDYPSGADQAADTFCAMWRSWSVFLGKDVLAERHESPWVTEGSRAWGQEQRRLLEAGVDDFFLAYPGPGEEPFREVLEAYKSKRTIEVMT
jgi:hypothetical protein